MKYILYYPHAKLKAVKGKRLRGNTAIVHLSIMIQPLKKKHLVTSRKENRQIGVLIFALKSGKINVFSVQSSFDGKHYVLKHVS